MTKTMAIAFFLFASFFLLADDTVIIRLFQKMPVEIQGWVKNPKYQVYDQNGLYDYIDGNAELYLSYGFQKLLAGTYSKTGQPEISIDFFDMGNSQNAFGVFSHSRETRDNSIGQGSEYAGGLLTFWKEKYYFSLLAYPETPEAKETVFALGRQIADLITEKGRLPEILELLPQNGLLESSVRYFRHHVWLNSHYFISTDNILHIDPSTEALLAAYRTGERRYFLLLVSYPDQKACTHAHIDFLKHFLPDNKDGIAQIEDGSWAGCRIQGNRIWIVLNAGNEKEVARFLDSAVKK